MLTGVGELLATPLLELTAQLPLTDEVAAALAGGGQLGTVLAAVQAYENSGTEHPSADHASTGRPSAGHADSDGEHADGADEPGNPEVDVDAGALALAYLSGLDWAIRTYHAVLGDGPGTEKPTPT
jgi:hypothetical protein